MPAETLEFLFDLGSPWSYIASTQLDGLAERTGARVEWRPFLLGGVFKATGNRSPFYETIENKLAYTRADMQAWVEHYGIPFRLPSRFPPNTLVAMRGALVAERAGRLVPYARAGYAAYFVDDLDLSDLDTVLAVAERAGLDRDAVRAGIDDPEVKDELKRRTEAAVARGAFGAPTLFWRNRMFFGNDRLGLLEASIRRAAR